MTTETALNLVKQIFSDTDTATPLECYVKIKEAEDLLKRAKAALVPAANKEYDELYRSTTGKMIKVGTASLQPYTPRGTWTYPEHINIMISNTYAARKLAEKDGSAVYTPAINANGVKFSVVFKDAKKDSNNG